MQKEVCISRSLVEASLATSRGPLQASSSSYRPVICPPSCPFHRLTYQPTFHLGFYSINIRRISFFIILLILFFQFYSCSNLSDNLYEPTDYFQGNYVDPNGYKLKLVSDSLLISLYCSPTSDSLKIFSENYNFSNYRFYLREHFPDAPHAYAYIFHFKNTLPNNVVFAKEVSTDSFVVYANPIYQNIDNRSADYGKLFIILRTILTTYKSTVDSTKIQQIMDKYELEILWQSPANYAQINFIPIRTSKYNVLELCIYLKESNLFKVATWNSLL